MLALALVIGIVAGLRVMMAPAAIAWAASAGRVPLDGTWLAWLGWRFAPGILSLLAIGELVADQLPATPSRTVPVQFGARLVSGGVSGAAIGIAAGALWTGAILGIVGAVIGTYGGARARGAMAAQFGSDRPAALVEDAVALALAAWVALSL